MNLMDFISNDGLPGSINKFTVVNTPNTGAVVTHTISSGTNMVSIRRIVSYDNTVWYDFPKLGQPSTISTWNLAWASYYVYPTVPTPFPTSAGQGDWPLILYFKAVPGQVLYFRCAGGVGYAVMVQEFSY